MVERTLYLRQLASWKDRKVIKVITGVRRCGKSTLLEQFQEKLLESGVRPEQIVAVNFEKMEYEELLDYHRLYAYIKERLQEGVMTYIFLDEIQNVRNYEKVVDSLYVRDNVDIYITGSNSYFLSDDLATLLSGRYVALSILPLSFSEVRKLSPEDMSNEAVFQKYMQVGGFPFVVDSGMNTDHVEGYIEGIYSTVILKDIVDRQRRKEEDKKRLFDAALLHDIARYLSSVVGSPISLRGIADYLTSNGRKVSVTTVSEYVEALCQAFVFYKVDRMDVVGKQLLKTGSKWYVVDLGLRNHVLPKQKFDLGFSVENIVYFELLRRGYKVNIGKANSTEIDFIAKKQDAYYYFQVTADMTNEDTFNREMAPLKATKDFYEKTVLTLDRFTPGNYEGIKVINAIDWLLENGEE